MFVAFSNYLFIVAAITDYLDGYIAKKYQQQTVFGKFFDPIADKLLVIITLFYICQCRFCLLRKELFICRYSNA
ncbi:CDP-alcohol phosphatidyltransferase family protein [Areca yellow leaf disease phytoplasma]|uniref:CDP-alcohol phosphatidyltransferase family protein n=1 Tax=Areca yellow leaf disease phytoplasma TaxID=927614 RepID=UPI0035B528B1